MAKTPKVSPVATLQLSFLPHAGALLYQPIDVTITSLRLNTPFGVYHAVLAPAQQGVATRTIQAVSRA